jgi:phenylacetate-CoA ligase
MGRAEDDISRIIDYYGTSDSGGPGLSTPLTAMIQNLCFKDTFLCMKLFNQSTVPSLFQQNPFLYVESVNNKIIVTYSGQLPLCRYDSGDNGNILKFTQVVQILKESGYKLDALISKHQIEDSIFEWPFIYLTGRSDYSVSIGGALVYPKDIEGLFFQEFANNINSFKLSIVEDVDHHQNFAVYLELKDKNNFGIQNLNEFKEVVKNKIVERLLSVNADFAAAYKMDKITCDPKIYICEYNTGLFFTEKRKLKSNFIHNLIQPQ